MVFSVEQVASCSECGGRLVRDDRVGLWCSACGLTVNTPFFDTRESTQYDEDGRREIGLGHGPPTPSGSRPAPTRIGYDRAARTAVTQIRLARMRLAERTYGSDPRERSMKDLSRQIESIGSRLGIGKSVRERALFIGRSPRHEHRGRPWSILASAYLLVAARDSALRSQDFAAVIQVKDAKVATRQIARLSRSLRREMGLSGVREPSIFLPRFIGELGLPHGVESAAREVLRLMPVQVGHSPTVAAAAALYTACAIRRVRVGQRRVADVAGCSEVSLRKVHFENLAHPKIAEQLGGAR